MTKEEALYNLNHIYGMVSPDIQRSLDIAIKALEEQPQGEWEEIKNPLRKNDIVAYKCNQCNNFSDFKSFYCDNCGAKMTNS